MQILLHFNTPDCPKNMGSSQKFPADDLQKFLDDRKDLLPNPTIEDDRITFDVTDGDSTRRGYAIMTEVPDDFENA